jgi:serine protease Do
MKHRSEFVSFVTVAALLFLLPAGSSRLQADNEPVTVHLKNGTAIQGEILRRKADRIVLDLGFTVLTIPASEVDRIETGEGSIAKRERRDIYIADPGREELTVLENVDRCGEAVLQVRTPTALGSGFIIHPDGYVVTNHHVISGERDITLTMFEQSERELRRVQFEMVRIVAMNPHFDLALLKIEDDGGRDLPVIPIGDSDRLLQGQTLFAIGSPLGLDRTVSQGIVSLKNRPLAGHLFVQSTVQVNPGNSGGPLLNLRGELVGINNMKIAATAVEGMSFAIPANVLKGFLENRDAFAFDPRNPNTGFRYNSPTGVSEPPATGDSQ